MELGGKSPFVVFDDADLERALDAAIFMIFSNNGERCTAGSRILVQRSIYAEFVARFAERAQAHPVGDPLDEKTIVGPMISRGHLGRCAATSSSAARKARRCCAAASTRPTLPAALRAATSCCRPSSPTSTTACASRRRRSSARSPA